MLPAVELTHFYAGNLSDGVSLVGGLEWTSQKRFFFDGLRRHPWINAGASQEKELLNAVSKSRVNEVGLNPEVFVEEVCRIGVIGYDASDLCGRDIHLFGINPFEEFVYFVGIGEVEFCMSEADRILSAGSERSEDGASYQACVSGDVDEFI